MTDGKRRAGDVPDANNPSRGKSCVLIVDDDADLREVLRAVLEEEGYSVATAATGTDALAILRANCTPCVVLLDHHLAGISGQGVLHALQSDPTGARHAVLYMSAGGASESAEVQAELARLQVPYLPKPFDIDELLAGVAEASARLAPARSGESIPCAAHPRGGSRSVA